MPPIPAACVVLLSLPMYEASGRRVTIIVAALSGVALTALFLSRFRAALLLLIETAVPALACVAVVLACYAAGDIALQVAGRRPQVAAEWTAAFLIGFATFGSVIGVVSWISVAPVPYVTIAFAIAGVYLLWRGASVEDGRVRLPATALVLAPAILIAFVQAITPVFSPDELVYKLAVPHNYEMYGRMVHLPLNSNSYLAMAFQLSDLAALMLGGGIAAKLLHFCVFIAALCATWQVANRFSPRSALFPVIVVAYTPAVMTTAGWAFNEWGVIGLLLVSFDRYQQWLDTRERADFAMAFAAAGSAAAGKYTALPWLAPFAVVVLWRHRREARVLASAALIAIAFGALFYLRNAVWTGSPVAPFLLPNAPAVQNYRSGVMFSGWRDLARGLDVIDPEITDEALGILLPVCFVFGLATLTSRDRATRDLLAIGIVQMVVLLTIGPGSRNIFNGVVAVAIPGAVLIGDAWLASGRAMRNAIAVIALIAIAAQSVTALMSIEEFGRYLTGSETGEEFIARTRSFTRPYQWIARSTPANARLLLIGETRGFYLPRQYVGGGNLDGPRVAAYLARFKTADTMSRTLHDSGITHVLFHPRWYRVASPNAPPVGMLRRELLLEVSPATHEMLMSFLRTRATLRYRDAEYLIFELR